MKKGELINSDEEEKKDDRIKKETDGLENLK